MHAQFFEGGGEAGSYGSQETHPEVKTKVPFLAKVGQSDLVLWESTWVGWMHTSMKFKDTGT